MDRHLQHLIDLEFLGLDEVDLRGLVSPFSLRTPAEVAEPHMHLLRLMRNPDYFWFTARHLFDVELMVFQAVLLREMWIRPFPMLIGSRGLGKSFLLAIYGLLRAIFMQGSKVVITGSGFRQAKTVFNVAETIWHKSPTLRSLFAEDPRSGPHHDADRWTLRLGDSTITALPIGDGTRIRGERANVIIADEFAAIQREIFETVIAGFGVVNLSPVEQVRDRARIRVLKKQRIWNDELAEQHRLSNIGNQLIISGTAYYAFNHFCDYWRRWKGIIESRGDRARLAAAIGGEPDDELDWRDYAVFRLPVTCLPEGYMDDKQIARSRATVHSGIFLNEFSAVFSSDSNGFFKRTLVESCVTKVPLTPNIPGAEPVQFRAVTRGHPDRRYVYGVDPASEHDRFSIVVLECHPGHRRIVHCWTTTRQEVKARLQSKLTAEEDFYRFCTRRIRDLMRIFPCELIALDSQGGGVAVIEALGDPADLKETEQPLYPITPLHPLTDGKERPTDDKRGLHLVEIVNFARAEYVTEANHKMRLDFEDRTLLFPNVDPAILAVAAEEDARAGRLFDTLEDAVMEIEELKDELATITHSQTPGTLRDHWDTPEFKLAGSKKGRLRKDRYSALLMANYAARRLDRHEEDPPLSPYGGFVDHVEYKDVAGDGPMYAAAPDWFTREFAEAGSAPLYAGYGLVSPDD